VSQNDIASLAPEMTPIAGREAGDEMPIRRFLVSLAVSLGALKEQLVLLM
jgi:hypothetical protein